MTTDSVSLELTLPTEKMTLSQTGIEQMPVIGEKAPPFTASTTQGPIHFPEDFVGKWVILFSHPASFTPVCTTEFMRFAELMPDFEALNTQPIGLAVDSVPSIIGWVREIEEKVKFDGAEHVHIPFPVIGDVKMEIAHKYGMIHKGFSDTKTVRAVFIIDPQSVIRAILYYPASSGRNFEEIKRLLISLQVVDAFDVATPADWQPGKDVIVPSPNSCEKASPAEPNPSPTGVWFLCTKKLSADEIHTKLKNK